MANHIEFRKLIRVTETGGGDAVASTMTEEILQYRTKDITKAVLGVIPVDAAWSDWRDIEEVKEFVTIKR